MSYQYKPTKIQLRANVSEDTDKIITNLSKAMGKAKGTIIEEMLSMNEIFIKAKSIKELVEEEHISKLKKELGI